LHVAAFWYDLEQSSNTTRFPSQPMNQELPEEVIHALLSVSKQTSELLGKISELLRLLLEKRITLEEKMIRNYYLQLAQTHSDILKSLFFCILNPDKTIVESKIIAELTEVNEKILVGVDDFLRAARHNLNYLEQYFEHDFNEGLAQSNLKARSEALLDALTKPAHRSTQE
jgi:hypothetical protein